MIAFSRFIEGLETGLLWLVTTLIFVPCMTRMMALHRLYILTLMKYNKEKYGINIQNVF